MDQMDLIARQLDEDPHFEKMRRAQVEGRRKFPRRVVITSTLVVGTLGVAGAGVAAVSNMLQGGKIAGQSVTPLKEAKSSGKSPRQGPQVVDGNKVAWSGEAGRKDAVMAPGGTGAVIDENGHVRIIGVGGEITASPDVTPDAAVVAGQLGKEDVIAWTTGRIMSWWTKSSGVKRVEHSRPLGLTAVGGGILVFDDEDWSGRLESSDVIGLIAGNDALTIAVLPDGTALATTVDGVITKWAPGKDMQVLQPKAPAEGVKVRRVAGLYSGHVVLVWDKPGDTRDDRKVHVTTMSVSDAKTVSTVQRPALQVAQASVVRSRTGAEFAGLLIHTNGTVEQTPSDFTVVGSSGDYLAVTRGAETTIGWLDVESGQDITPDEGVTFQLSSSSSRWVGQGNRQTFTVIEESGQ